ncbi:MAG: iron chelate uptake ABC transporter family permease subunit [Oscillospiraceae bacterium]
MLIIVISVMIGITVSVCGGIGFVGLIAPNASRMLVGSNHKYVFLISALIGGILVLWCDVASRMLFAPEEISVGIITALIGGPLFLRILKKHPN